MNGGPSSEMEHGAEKETTGSGNRPGEGVPPTETPTPSEPGPLPKDVIFDLLSAERRRVVLDYLAEEGPESTLSDLADHIAADENDTEIRLLDSQQRKRVYVALYQCHLPRMDDADVIDFNHARGTVELRSNASTLYPYMELEPQEADGTDTHGEDRFSELLASVRSKLGE